MTKENPCNKCCSYKQNKVCECNELFAYRHYQQGREDGIDDVLFILYDKGYINSDDEEYVREMLKENKK